MSAELPRHQFARRAVIAIPFFAAIVAAARLDRGPIRASADPARPGFVLHDETAAAGIHFVHQRPSFDPKIANIEPHVAALGASVSVGDFDGDGFPDLYFTTSRFGEPNALYRNKGDGTFDEVAASAGLADLNRPGEGVSMGSVWGDFDNDGREDLLVYRYGYLALFKNLDGHHFQDVTQSAGLHRWMNSNGAIWIDYDRDGLLDLYVTGYFRDDIDLWHLSTTRIMHDSFEFATNGGKNLLFHNLGNGKFEDVTDKLGVGSTRWTLAAASADFNEDGWPDIYLANDYGPEELYLNDHGKRFVLSTAGLESESKSGMSVALGDVYNRGHLDVFVTDISERGYLFQNNNLRLNEMTPDAGSNGKPRFHNMADAVVADAGWAWGAQFGDLNNDGSNELFVANGFISADSTKSYWYAMSKIAGERPPLRGREHVAGVRERESVRLRAFARVSQSRPGRLGRRRATGWHYRSLRRASSRARRSLEPRRARRDRGESESAGSVVSQSARQHESLDRPVARGNAEQSERDWR